MLRLPGLCWGGRAVRHYRSLLLAGVAVGKQGLRFQLTLSVLALRGDSRAGRSGRWAGSSECPGGRRRGRRRAGAQLGLWTRPGAGAPGRRADGVVGRSRRLGGPRSRGTPPHTHPSSKQGREGSTGYLAAGSQGRFRLLCPQRCSTRAMEPSGSLFPSLVVVGHAVTLAAVWHWRRGRWRVQDVQGKRLWQLPPGPSWGCGSGTGRGGNREI